MAALLTPEQIAPHAERVQGLLSQLNQIILGQAELTHQIILGMLAGGHVLLEGLPGLGKTELVKALAALSGCQFRRVQFTPDLLPGDITGTQVLQQTGSGERELVFRPGPVFTQVLLADEINRASPKTQAALLEAMSERQVTNLGETRPLPHPFFVLATQNPIEQDGTYPLPEAQLDRFTLRCLVTGIDEASLEQLITQRPEGRPPTPQPVCDGDQLEATIAAARQVVIPTAVANYIARLVQATRPELPDASASTKAHIRWGASPRAALALAGVARARALSEGRPAVGFDDVNAIAIGVMAHRLVVNYEAVVSGMDQAAVVKQLLSEVSEVPA